MGVKWTCALCCLLVIANVATQEILLQPTGAKVSSQEQFSSPAMGLTGPSESSDSSSSSSPWSGAPINSWSYNVETDSDNPGRVRYSYIDSTGKTVQGTATEEEFQNDNPLKGHQEAFGSQASGSFQQFFNQNNRMRFGPPAQLSFPFNFGFGNNRIFRSTRSSNFKDLNSAGVHRRANDEGPGITSASPGAKYKFFESGSGSKNSHSSSSSSKSISGIGPDGKPYSHKVRVNEINDNGKVTIERFEE